MPCSITWRPHGLKRCCLLVIRDPNPIPEMVSTTAVACHDNMLFSGASMLNAFRLPCPVTGVGAGVVPALQCHLAAWWG